MADQRLADARQSARSAIESYNSLDRNQLMDEGVLKRHVTEIQGALDSLVKATDSEYGGEPADVREQAASARQALEQFEDPTSYDGAQQVRRACYVLRKETTSLLDTLEGAE